MRIINFAKRNFKEIIRDPLSVIFSVVLPLFLLYIFQQFKIPNDVYKIENFTPGIIVFSLAFITLFTATLVAKDRQTSFITRLCVSPMKPIEYIIGYMLALIPFIIIQSIMFFTTAAFLGLKININILYTILVTIPISILFIGFGILIGSITTEKSASGVSSIVVQLVAFTSGMYFEKSMVGNTFAKICEILPFEGTLNIIKNVLNQTYTNMFKYIITVAIYILVTLVITIIVFKKNMIKDNK